LGRPGIIPRRDTEPRSRTGEAARITRGHKKETGVELGGCIDVVPVVLRASAILEAKAVPVLWGVRAVPHAEIRGREVGQAKPQESQEDTRRRQARSRAGASKWFRLFCVLLRFLRQKQSRSFGASGLYPMRKYGAAKWDRRSRKNHKRTQEGDRRGAGQVQRCRPRCFACSCDS
jgi:hypothetical protein